MKHRPLISAGALSRLFEEAAEAWRHQDYDKSIAALEKASRQAPSNVRVLLDLARAQGMRYNFPAAEQNFEKAIRIAPQRTEVLITAATHCHDFGNYGMAAKYLERAAQQNSVPAEALVRLAELHERQHRMEEADNLIQRALKSAPGHPSALLAQSRLQRLAGQLEVAQAGLRSLAENTKIEPWTRARSWYELGAILDRQSRYDEAMAAFLEAKALLRPGAKQAAATLASIQARVREMEQTVTAAVLQRWHDAARELAPTRRLAVLCGHPRSGTTLLEQVLDSHPDIVSAEETHILHDEAYLPLTRDFSAETSIVSVLDSSPVSQLEQSRENYFRCTELFLDQKLDYRLLVDKNPALNVLIPAVVRIFPEAKFLVAIRDPRDVCLSCFMQPLSINPVSSSYLTLEGTATQYASVVGFWRTILPRMANAHLEIRYEDMVESLETVSRKVLDFLDVPWNPGVLQYDQHARTKLVRSPTYAEVTRPVFKTAVGRWHHYRKYLEPCLEKLRPFVEAFGYAR